MEITSGIKSETQKLIKHGKNLLKKEFQHLTIEEMGIKEGDKYLLLGSSPYDVEIVQSLTPDRLVLGFEEEIQRQKKR